MTKIQKSIASMIATGAMLANSAMPIFATTTLVITGNGTDTTNTVDVSKETTTSVTQTNNTSVDNNVNITSKTGSNTAEDNTGGGVEIRTGDSEVGVNVQNQVNSNVASVEACGTCDTSVDALISGNGSESQNHVGLDLNSEKEYSNLVTQDNTANIDNNIDVDSSTGKNLAEDTTGGNVVISSGDSSVTMSARTVANSNTAVIEGNGDGGSIEALVTGNGTDTNNTVALAMNKVNWIVQDNHTSIDNDLEAESKTGKNEVEDSTGGIVGIGSGDSTITVEVDNAAGFNAADLSCCSVGDVLAKIAGNGEDADSHLSATLENNQGVTQDNSCGMSYNLFDTFFHGYQPCFDNELELDGFTGDNFIGDSTGSVDDDPLVLTGDSEVGVEINNAGGSNTYGDVELPEVQLPGGFGLDLSFDLDWADLMALLHGNQS